MLQLTRQFHRLDISKLSVYALSKSGFSSQCGFCAKETDKAVIQRVVRETHVSEVATTSFFEALATASGGRPDVELFAEQERQQLRMAASLVPRHRARPSLLQPAISAAASALGTAAAVLPANVRNAVVVGVHEAAAERANDQLRELRERGIQKQVPDLRAVLRETRDLPRVPAGAPEIPDLLERLAAAKESGRFEIPSGVPGLLGAVVKLVAQASLSVAAKV